MKSHLRLASLAAVICAALLPYSGSGQARALALRIAGGNVNMPHSATDNQGNQWMIYPGGWCQMQGNSPVYSQGGMLLINGGQASVRNNQARMDDKTGEIIFENLTANGFTVTRRILIDKENACVRYIDIIKNPQNAEQSIN